jgi:SAM-dependent methyltransferase
MTAILRAEPQVAEAFRTGRGLPWAEHAPGLFDGTERFFRRAYRVSLVSEWLPALEGVVPKLEAGARVADVGCGYGAAAVLLAQAFPRTDVTGYDNHAPSIERARRTAADAGVADRVRFEVAGAAALPDPPAGAGYDLVAYFDSFHDMGDPVRVARRAREVLARDGTVLLVEPQAGERPEDNLTPFGRLASAASTLVCTPNALAEGDTALGQLYADGELQSVFQEAGFGRFRRAAQTPFNRVFEARP